MTRISGFGEQEYANHQSTVRDRPARMAEIVKRNAVPKRPKYGAKRVYEDRIWFASLRELGRYRQLRAMERTGIIRDLVVHPSFPLIVSGIQIGRYNADFRYLERGVEIVEDVKSPATEKKETFRRIKRIMAAQYGIVIAVVY